ncbi:RICIN domain-containing protein [Chitinophaga rhizophila]|uniref:RICIN domain-containing protein n=1 Tax=Chitinophaga rhizophila TaxID=2866212 RepID=A0ABS7G995_9BACT|nr:RICIN domain-containing protein [Chitinophaga rhizophila]MBW8683880.1 RICIN domain-containing protein [Chitinophaga rhizophila]
MKHSLIIITFVVLGLCLSCSSRKMNLEQKVLAHFEKQQHPEKLQAARYLLKHMKGHYSLGGPNYDKYVKIFHEISVIPGDKRNAAIMDRMNFHKIGDSFFMKKDEQALTAEYLIKHIEYVYAVWEKVPWRKDYDFDIFCEYVLPYRVENEHHTDWIERFHDAFAGIFRELHFTGGTVYKAVDYCSDTVRYIKMEDGDSTTLVKLTPGKDNITFDSVMVDEDGDKWVRIQYTSGLDSAKVRLVINGKDTITKNLNTAGSLYCYPGHQVRIKHPFRKGLNTIEVSVSSKPIGLDYLDIIPAEKYYRDDPGFKIIDGANYAIYNAGNDKGLHTLLKYPQKVNIQNIDYGFFVLRTKEQKNALTLAWNTYYSQDTLRQTVFSGNDNQQWAVVPVGDDHYKIVSKLNGKCMEVTNDGRLAVRNDYSGSAYQHWRFERVDNTLSFDTATHVPQNTPLEYACRVKDALNFEWMTFSNYFPALPANDILTAHVGDCRAQSHYLVYILRSLGIPAVSEVNLQRPNKNMGHDWNAIIGSKGETIYYQIDTKPATGKPDSPIAKIYRRTFSVDSSALPFKKYPNEFVPLTFDNPYLKDVTKDYFSTRTVSVDLFSTAKGISDRHAYLCVWDDTKWLPVAWGDISNGTATFRDMGLNALYLPVIYKDEKTFVPIGAPFILKDSLIEYISPAPDKQIQAALTRKYYWPEKHFMDYRLRGGAFQAANKEDFSDAVTLYTVKGKIAPVAYNIPVKDPKAYKYYRFKSPDHGYGNIAELKFYDKAGRPMQGKIIGSDKSYKLLGNTKEKAFDNDILTFYDGFSRKSCWLGMEMAEAKPLGKIKFVARNDGNCIEVGDDYELMYWDNKTWQSLGLVIAREDVLEYKNCPKGAVFLLRNKTKGKQERIFTIDDSGKQVWW